MDTQSSVDGSLTGGRRLTPMLRQYVSAKAECPKDSILLFRMGDFYEMFFEDAVIAARVLEITLTAREKGDDPIPMAGVPHHAITSYIAKLVQHGYCVAICDQVEDPKKAKGLVKRAITRLITPGTVSDLEALDPGAANYLSTVKALGNQEYCVAFLDLLAGELLWTRCSAQSIADELRRMGTREVLLSAEDEAAFGAQLRTRQIAIRVLEDQGCSEPGKILEERFGENWAKEHDLGNDSGVVTALNSLVQFAESTQRRSLVHLMKPKFYSITDYLVLDEATRSNLELIQTQREGRKKGSLLWHLNRCRTAVGSRTLGHWILFPLRDAASINRRLDSVSALKSDRPLRDSVQASLDPVRDIERLVGRVAVARATPRDLGALRSSLHQIPAIQTLLESHDSPLGRRWATVDKVDNLRELLNTALVDDPPTSALDGGIFARGYQADLDKLISASEDGHQFLVELEERERQSTGISKLKVRYNKVFGYFIEVSKAQQNLVPEHYIRKQTLVNAERYITEELKDFESTVLNADANRKEREFNLFAALVQDVATEIDRLRVLSRLVAETDALLSLGQVADEYRYTRPSLVSERVLELEESRHPVIERLMPGGEAFVPNSLSLCAKTNRLSILTGPNMGGKSTVMRQAALSAIMAHMGSFVPATSAKIGLFDRVFTRVGASDDLSQGNSTFMVEMIETATILRDASERSLVILDEIGRGTSTYDGISIAWAVAEFLYSQSKALTMFATHYHELTALADDNPAITNCSVAVRQKGEKIVFLRQLVKGSANRSYGIQVAGLAGLPQEVQERAKAILTSLESSRDQAKSPEASNKAAQKIAQLSLFGGPPVVVEKKVRDPLADELLASLQELKIEDLTPVQAMVELDRLKRLTKG